MRPSSTLRAVRALMAALVLFTHTPAFAVTRDWNNVSGGSADAAANWTPAGAPTSADILSFGLANTYTVSFPAPLDSVSGHLFFFGNITLDCTAPHYGTGLFIVGSGPTSNATATLSNGNFRMGTDARIGDVAGAVGLLQVVGASASLTQAPTGTEFRVGNTGTGTLLVTSGGQAAPASQTIVGQNVGAIGTITARGEASLPTYQPSRLTLTNGGFGSGARIGYLGGRGTLEVLDGAQCTSKGSISVGVSPGDTGTVRVGGVPATDSARIVISGDLDLARGIGGGQPGGNATVQVDSNGVVVVQNTTRIGSTGSATGLLRVRKGGRFNTGWLEWNKSGGDLDFPGGTIQVQRGTFTTSDSSFKLNSLVGKPVFELLDGALARFHPAGGWGDTALWIGVKGAGHMNVSNGSTLDTYGSQAVLGQQAGSVGELVFHDQGQPHLGGLVLGSAGQGEFRVIGGSTGSAYGILVGEFGGTGILVVRDAGSRLTTNYLYAPTRFPNPTGIADVTVGTGGELDLTSSIWSSNLSAGGTCHVESGATLDFTSPFQVDGGLLDLQGGTVSSDTSEVSLSLGGTIQGTGDVAAAIASHGDSSGVITATGALALGSNAVAGTGFRFDGTLAVAGDTVTIRDAGRALLGKVSMTGGRLVLPAGGGRIALGRELSGRGTVVGDLANAGQLRSVGTAGLRFTGPVSGVGHAMLGDKFVFMAGSHFTGAGTIAASVQFDSLSTLTATGDVVAGLATATPVLQGRIEPAGWRVEFPSATDVTLGDEVAFGNGRIACSGAATGFVLAADGRLSGRGIVEGTLVSSGTLSPGDGVGRLRVTGDLTQSAGTYTCEATGAAGATHDTIVVVGTATLGGALDVRPLAGFTATTNDSFKVLQYGARIGTWATVLYNGLPAAGVLEVHYAADGAWVVVKQGTLDAGDPPAPAAPRALRFAATGSPGPGAALELALPVAADADVRLFDVGGRELAALHHGALAAGLHRFPLAGRDLPAGVLFARASVSGGNGRVLVTRIVHLR